jgi:CheY-like chemotaxis protein
MDAFCSWRTTRLVGDFAAQLLADLGFSALWVASGADALAAIDREPSRFAVVFSDIVMPGMSGIELAETLSCARPDLPLVLTSGYSHVLAEEGAHGFELLRKPYTAEELARTLRKTLRH